jgi:hypothetical protein
MVLLILLLLLMGCEKKSAVQGYESVTEVRISDLLEGQSEYTAKKISVEAYVLGNELYQDSKNGRIWIMVLGDQPQLDDSKADQLIFPGIKNKIRVAEDGYNRDIIDRCFEACRSLRKRGRLIRVYGVFNPAKKFNHVHSGIDLELAAIKVDGTIIDTDYDDHSNFAEKTPSVMKKIYKGSKGISKAIRGGL